MGRLARKVAADVVSYDARAVAEAVGTRTATIARLCRQGKIPGAYQSEDGGHWRVPLSALEAWLRERKTQAARAEQYPKRDGAWWRAYHDAHSEGE